MMIFGYGSLIAAEFINGRGMQHQYEESELQVCELMGYQRAWNAYCSSGRFLGIVEAPKLKVNGVIFPIELSDLDVFLESEGFNNPEPVYVFLEVTDKIVPKVDDKVYTCVTVNPCEDYGKIPPYYMRIIAQCLAIRGHEFTKDFMRLTEPDKL